MVSISNQDDNFLRKQRRQNKEAIKTSLNENLTKKDFLYKKKFQKWFEYNSFGLNETD